MENSDESEFNHKLSNAIHAQVDAFRKMGAKEAQRPSSFDKFAMDRGFVSWRAYSNSIMSLRVKSGRKARKRGFWKNSLMVD